jgi:protein disulfide-isomerase
MKLLHAISILGWAVTVIAAAEPVQEIEKSHTVIFNGEEVPPMLDLTGSNIKETTAHGNWLIEYYSPYCGHCQLFAPTWQKMYEFYYTLKPITGSSKTDSALNTFTNYYNFKFARIDCIAHGDTCMEADPNIAWPTIMWYQDGKQMKKNVGSMSLEGISKWFEDILESVRPGSRPQGGPNLPNMTATVAPSQPTLSSNAGTASVVAIKPAPTYNPSGTSINLDAKNFKSMVAKSKDPWLVKFYAPWCHHCQALAGAWAEMARDMKMSLNIGEVNCDVEKSLCKEMGVKGYPTINFIKNGEKVEYQGLRRLGDLLAYAKAGAQVGVDLEEVNVESFRAMEKRDEVIFIYFYDEATTSEDFAALDRVQLSLIGHGTLVKSKDDALAKIMRVTTKPSLVVSRDGVKDIYPYISPKDLRNYRQLLEWMATVWHPLVPELMPSNAHELMEDSIIVLGVLSRERESQFDAGKAELKTTAKDWIERAAHVEKLELQELREAKELKIAEAKDRNDHKTVDRMQASQVHIKKRPKIRFAWVDGVFWERWLKSTYHINLKDGETVIIIDENVSRSAILL